MTFKESTTPYEKAGYSSRYMSDKDLLEGIVGKKYISRAMDLYRACNNDLNELARVSIQDVEVFLPKAKSLALVCALELSRRRSLLPEKEKATIRSSADAYRLLVENFKDLPHEEFWMLCLNRGNNVIKKVQISKGGMSGVVVDSKMVFMEALKHGAASIIVAHNHPSGQLRPSSQDVAVTSKLVAAGKSLDMPVLDHIIVTNASFYSFADEGRI